MSSQVDQQSSYFFMPFEQEGSGREVKGEDEVVIVCTWGAVTGATVVRLVLKVVAVVGGSGCMVVVDRIGIRCRGVGGDGGEKWGK